MSKIYYGSVQAMLSLFDVVAVLSVLTALFAWINHVTARLPSSTSLLLMGLIASVVLIGLELLFANVTIFHELNRVVREIDFSQAVLNGMLAFLLFASAINVDLSRLRERKWIVGTMATIGVFISTIVVAVLFWLSSNWLSVSLPFAWALVFGALVSPTDPVAVLTTLKKVRVRETLAMDMAGESLLNDGVGVVLFTILLTSAMSAGDGIAVTRIAERFVVEAIGGGLLGLLTGYAAYRAMGMIDDYPIEVLISFALVMGTYALASRLHVSGPIAVVAAGILIGNRGATFPMSETTKNYLFIFWTLVDEMLNSALFLLIGLEVVVLSFDLRLVPLALAAIPIVLIARLVAVSIPILALSIKHRFERGTIAVLTWGGVRGGISIALALSINAGPQRPSLLAATYTVAVFTIVVQGLTLGWVIEKCGATGSAQLSQKCQQ
jgi:monovalent cation:H+ antiporter, CPA1 family